MKSKRILLITTLIFSSLLTQIPQANAWESDSSTTDFGDNQFMLLTYFKSGVGAAPSKRPSGPHKQLSMACTAGFFEIGFFDLSTYGDILTIGSPTTMKVKFDGKLAPTSTRVNTEKGTSYVQVNDAKALVKKLKTAKTFSVEMALSSSFYRATFSVQDIKKYVSKFAAAGCKI
jgi:hypothetical protein